MSLVKHKLKSSALKTEAKKEKESLERRKLGNQPAIKHFGESLEALKVKYEQYFLGIEKFTPSDEHTKFKRMIRQMKQLLQKSAEDNFRISTIEQSYLTLNNLWEKSLRQKEQGTYKRDLFRARMSAESTLAKSPKLKSDHLESSQVDKIIDDFKSKSNLDLCPNNQAKIKSILLSKIKELKKKDQQSAFTIEIAIQDGKLGLRTKYN